MFISRWSSSPFISSFSRTKLVLLLYLSLSIFVNVRTGTYLALCRHPNVELINSPMALSSLQTNVISPSFNASKTSHLPSCSSVPACRSFPWRRGRMFMLPSFALHVFLAQSGRLLTVPRIPNRTSAPRKLQEEEWSPVVDCWTVFWWAMARSFGGVEDRVATCLDSEGVMLGSVEMLAVMHWML